MKKKIDPVDFFKNLEQVIHGLVEDRDHFKAELDAKAEEVRCLITDKESLTEQLKDSRDNNDELCNRLANIVGFDEKVMPDLLVTEIGKLSVDLADLKKSKLELETAQGEKDNEYRKLSAEKEKLIGEKKKIEVELDTVKESLVTNKIVTKGADFKDLDSLIKAYASKFKQLEESILSLEIENGECGIKNGLYNVFLANVLELGYDHKSNGLEGVLNEVYASLKRLRDLDNSDEENITISYDDRQLPLPFEEGLPERVAKLTNSSLSELPPPLPVANVTLNEPVTAASFFKDVIADVSAIPAEANAKLMDQTKEESSLHKLPGLPWYNSIIHRIGLVSRPLRVFIAASVVVVGVSYVGYNFSCNPKPNPVSSVDSNKREQIYIQNRPDAIITVTTENKNNIEKSGSTNNYLQIGPKIADKIVDVITTPLNYEVINKKPIISNFSCPDNMVAGKDTSCIVVAEDDTGIERCVLTYRLNNYLGNQPFNSERDSSKLQFGFNLDKYCKSQGSGYPCKVSLDVICYDLAGEASDLFTKGVEVKAQEIIVTKSTEVRPVSSPTSCGKNALKDGFDKPDDWGKYSCRTPEEGENCLTRDQYTSSEIAKSAGLKYGCTGENKQCCPPKQK